MSIRAVYPGTFDPLTVAHLGIAHAAHRDLGVDTVHLVLSEVPLGRESSTSTSIDARIRGIERVAEPRQWLRVARSPHRLLADLAEGFDWLVLGADKWHQLHDVAFYDDAAHRDRSLANLPNLAVAPRAGAMSPRPSDRVHILDIDPDLEEVSATAVRAGRHEWRADRRARGS